MTLTEAIQMLSRDPDFRRGFRRGTGLVLAGWIIMQILACVLWPLMGAS